MIDFNDYEMYVSNDYVVVDSEKQKRKAEKKAAKKAKKKAMKKAQADADHAIATLKKLQEEHGVKQPKAAPKAKKAEPEKREFKPFTEEEKKQFRSRIENEKKNIWRMFPGNPEGIIKFCNENKADEKNAAIRFARRDAMKWAAAQLGKPF